MSTHSGGMQLKKVFRRCDKSSDGKLSFKEFWEFLQVVAFSITVHEARAVFEKCDVDNDGQLDFNEFVDFVFSPDEINWNALQLVSEPISGKWEVLDQIAFRRKCRDCHVINSDFTIEDVDSVFAQVCPISTNTISDVQFKEAVELISNIKLHRDMTKAVTAETVKQKAQTTSGSIGYYTDKESIKQALTRGNVVLLRDFWVLKLYHEGGILPRCQDLPSDAIWSIHEEPWDNSDLFIIAISYCWLTKEHPDPKGEQFHKFIGPMLEVFLQKSDAFSNRRAAIFLDWCSLPQTPRSVKDMKKFSEGLKDVNLWYAHKRTLVWMLTRTPEGVIGFMDRGWPCFERAISSMFKDSDKMLDLGALDFDWADRAEFGSMLYSDIRDMCIVKRPPPMVPEKFMQLLTTKAFTNGSDKVFVAQKYAQTFFDLICQVEHLKFSHLRWEDAHVVELCTALHHCRCLRCLVLSSNQIRNVIVLSEFIVASTTCLEELNLGGNNIVDLTTLAHALGSDLSLKRLNLCANGIEDAAPLGTMLATNKCLRDLDLSSNRLKDVSGMCKGLRANAALQQLHLELNSIGDSAPLCQVIEQNTSLKMLDLRANDITEDCKERLHKLWVSSAREAAELAL